MAAVDPKLQHFYQENIYPNLLQLEQQRRHDYKLIKFCWLAIILGSIAVIIVAFILGDEVIFEETVPTIFFVTGLIAALSGLFTLNKLQRKLRSGLKQTLVSPVCKFLGYTFTAKGFNFPLQRFIDAAILPNNANIISLEDHIRGNTDGVNFSLCEANMVRETSDANNNTNTEQLFRGIVLIYDFPKPFSCHIRVTPKKWRRGNYQAKIKGEKVVLEDPKFGSMFTVFATDQIESRYILTPGFMEKITHLAEHFAKSTKNIAFGFSNKSLVISITTNHDRFEGGSLKKSFLDNSRLESLVDELNLIKEIVAYLNLTDNSHS